MKLSIIKGELQERILCYWILGHLEKRRGEILDLLIERSVGAGSAYRYRTADSDESV